MFDDFERELRREEFTLEPFFLSVVTSIEAAAKDFLPKASIRYFKCGGCGALHCFVVSGRGRAPKEHLVLQIDAGQWHPKS